MWVFCGMFFWIFNCGGVCVGGCFLIGDEIFSEVVFWYEVVYKVQWFWYGFLMFVFYFFVGWDLLCNCFEIEVGFEDGNYV